MRKTTHSATTNYAKSIIKNPQERGYWEAGVRNNFLREIQVLLELHWQAMGEALRKTMQVPFTSITSSLTIAIAFTLPTLLYLTVVNLQTMIKSWEGLANITVYLTPDLKNPDIQKIHEQLTEIPSIKNIRFVSAKDGLQELNNLKNANKIISILNTNPLPNLYKLNTEYRSNVEEIQKIAKRIIEISGVDAVKTHTKWEQRLFGVIDLLQAGLLVLSTLFSMLILLSINSIVLQFIMQSRAEIQVITLVGGSNGFIALPFFYVGVTYGLLGALLAALIVWGQSSFIMIHIQQIVTSYESTFLPFKPGLETLLSLIFCGVVLGGVGALFGTYKVLKHHF